MKKNRIFIVYPTNPIFPESTISVPRINAQTAMMFSDMGYEVVILGKKTSFNYPNIKIISIDDNVNILKSVIWRKLYNVRNVNSKQFNINAKIILDNLYKQGDILISCTVDTTLFLLKHYNSDNIIHWLRSTPKSKSFTEFIPVLQKKISIVFPSHAIYRFCWEKFNHDVIPFNGFNIHNLRFNFLNNSTELKLQDVILNSKFNPDITFIHAGDNGINKGLSLITRVFKTLESKLNKKVRLIYINKNDSISYQSSSLEMIELSRMNPTQLAFLFNNCDIGILSSLCFDNLPTVLLEFLETGLYPLAANTGGVLDILKGYEYSLVDDPNLVSAWQTKILEIVNSDYELLNEKRTINKKKALEYIDQINEKTKNDWEALFNFINS